MNKHYIYNKVKKAVGGLLLLPILSFVFVGCEDFLEIQPTDVVVLENYWKEKLDVTSAVSGCYEALSSDDVLSRLAVWGELRSDNIIAGTNPDYNMSDILKENLMPNNSFCDWAKVYNVINRCNTVIHYAPEVQSIDPNYTYEEMKATVAEMKAMRAFCYFTLIRTFREVPFTTEPSIDDNQEFVLPAMPFNEVLDTLIADLEAVKDDALRRTIQEKVTGGSITVAHADNGWKNYGYITRWAIRALLADMYLWKGDWDNVIKNCDEVLDYKKLIYDDLTSQYTIDDVALFNSNGTPMIPMITEASGTSTTGGTCYNQIFGQGNSFESIFEINYDGSPRPENNYVANYYGTSGRLRAANFILNGFELDKSPVYKNTDCRAYEFMKRDVKTFNIMKYSRQSASFNLTTITSTDIPANSRSRRDANWIVYRLSDVMLMKAEALIERGAADYPAAFELIDNVNKRANNVKPNGTSKLNYAAASVSKITMEDLLFEERQREFMFEGKRWFDLVRLAVRDGNTTRLSDNVMRKHEQDITVIKVKLADPNYIFWPYARREIKVNPLLHQNPAFNKGEESILQ